MGNNFQAIFGTKSDALKDEIKSVIAGNIGKVQREIKEAQAQVATTVSTVSEIETFVSPITGKIVSLTEVPDKVFSSKMLGDGFAVEPIDSIIVAPADGEIVTLFPTKHAIGIKTTNGTELLIHVGIDTVKLDGKGFEALVSEKDKIKQGQPLLKLNLDYIKENAPSIMTPVLFTNLPDTKTLEVQINQDAQAGKTTVVKIK